MKESFRILQDECKDFKDRKVAKFKGLILKARYDLFWLEIHRCLQLLKVHPFQSVSKFIAISNTPFKLF